VCIDPQAFVELLDRANYLASGEKKLPWAKKVDTAAIRGRLRKVKPPPPRGALKEERIIEGTKVSPGRVLGPVLFGAQGRRPEDFDGAVMVSPSVHPDDNTYLYHTSGIVTTGGSILSHAGLLAMQFRKPSMIVDGKWRTSSKGEPILLYYPLDFTEKTERTNGYQVSMRRNIHYREHRLHEGDLVVLDANNGFLRVLGQGRDALVLHENLCHFGKVCQRLFKTSDDRKFLEIRGERLKTLYHIEKHLSKLVDPVLACHVIHELLLGEHLSGIAKNVNENARLLSRILDNPKVGDTCRAYLLATARQLADRYRTLAGAIRQRVPSSNDPVEILTWRLREIRLGQVLKITKRITDQIGKSDRSSRKRRGGRRILWLFEAGFEFFPDIGWKAANLAEIERIGGNGLTPPWFVITDAAFREVMDRPLGCRFSQSGEFSPDIPLKEAIQIYNR
jgi:phosphohistidine swiveling domain-containing protein